MGNKVSITSYDDIKKAGNLLNDAKTYVNTAMNKINGMGINQISGPGMAPAGIMVNIKNNISEIMASEATLLSKISDDLINNAKFLEMADRYGNANADTSGAANAGILSGGFGKAIQIVSNPNKTIKTEKKKTKKKKRKKVNEIMSMLSADIMANTNAVIGATIKTVNSELKKLKKYLQKGNLTSAASAYKFLKSFGKESDAKKILDKYGYKVEEKNGKYVISKKVNESSNTTTKPSTNTDNLSTNNSNENDVVAEETVNKNTEKSPIVINEESNQNQTETVVNAANTNNNSNNNNYSNSSNNGQNVVENTSTEVNNADTNTQGETNTTTSSGDSTKESMKETPKNNVVTITDDNKTTTTKKSSGLGAAVPIGLGTIATGAAAVAGVRYVKNRHDNQEEYDENYDDENNNLEYSDEYVDSAQYDDGSSYMDDDYLGPIKDNNASSQDSYVDPGDLEEIEGFSGDAVLEDLNSNY